MKSLVFKYIYMSCHPLATFMKQPILFCIFIFINATKIIV